MLRYFLLLLLLLHPLVFAASREALVIGNSGYEQGHGLDGNPLRDAETMANVLKQVGFSVILKKDLSLNEMEEAVRTFQSRLNENTVALFYFSGHGVQRDGENYLIPLGAIRSIVAPGHLKDKTMNVNYVLSIMENAKSAVNLVFLDACRDNPFKGLFKGNATVGLANPSETPSGTLIAYATKAGAQSWTGEKGDNSPFVKVLAQELAKPGVPITEMLTKVRTGVMKVTDNSQAPSYYNELNGTFCFVEPCGQAPQLSQAEADRLKKLEDLKKQRVSPSLDDNESISKESVFSLFYKFITAWNDKDYEQQVSCLSSDFYYVDAEKKQNYSQYLSNKKRLFSKYGYVSVEFSNEHYAVLNAHEATISYHQTYKSPCYQSDGKNTLYFTMLNGQVKISREEFRRDSYKTMKCD